MTDNDYRVASCLWEVEMYHDSEGTDTCLLIS